MAAPKRMYGNHPMGTKSSADLNRHGRLRWRERTTDGVDHPVTVTRFTPVPRSK